MKSRADLLGESSNDRIASISVIQVFYRSLITALYILQLSNKGIIFKFKNFTKLDQTSDM